MNSHICLRLFGHCHITSYLVGNITLIDYRLGACLHNRRNRPRNKILADRHTSLIHCRPKPPFEIGSDAWIHWRCSSCKCRTDSMHIFKLLSISDMISGKTTVGMFLKNKLILASKNLTTRKLCICLVWGKLSSTIRFFLWQLNGHFPELLVSQAMWNFLLKFYTRSSSIKLVYDLLICVVDEV